MAHGVIMFAEVGARPDPHMTSHLRPLAHVPYLCAHTHKRARAFDWPAAFAFGLARMELGASWFVISMIVGWAFTADLLITLHRWVDCKGRMRNMTQGAYD